MNATTDLGHNPLAGWAAQRLGITTEQLTPDAIRSHQLGAVRETVTWARQNSPFYAAQLASFPQNWPSSLEEFASSPFTSAADISASAHGFVCVPQSEISRVVTIETSGTTGQRKRIFFTAADQELALSFFAHGVASMASENDRMLIALPCEREGSVGYQLALGIARAGVVPTGHGLATDVSATLARMDEKRATMLIGLPVQVLALALDGSEAARRVFRRVHTIVLCSDHVPRSLANKIRRETGCTIFEHYGSTEMGLGGGLECHSHSGYHLREADLYFEIISLETGEPLRDGETGEIVFTTLSRVGMPLIRYRTGDLGWIKPSACSCGLPLRRLAHIKNRIEGAIRLGPEGHISISALDEALFAIPQLLDFSAAFAPGKPNQLEITVYAPEARDGFKSRVQTALDRMPVIAANFIAGTLRVTVAMQDKPFPMTGAKRRITLRRDAASVDPVRCTQEVPSLS